MSRYMTYTCAACGHLGPFDTGPGRSAGAAPNNVGRIEQMHAEFIEARDSFEIDSDSWAVWNTAATRVLLEEPQP